MTYYEQNQVTGKVPNSLHGLILIVLWCKNLTNKHVVYTTKQLNELRFVDAIYIQYKQLLLALWDVNLRVNRFL
jgi:hypothetical protein